jgi:hypothetical protein
MAYHIHMDYNDLKNLAESIPVPIIPCVVTKSLYGVSVWFPDRARLYSTLESMGIPEDSFEADFIECIIDQRWDQWFYGNSHHENRSY